MTLRTVRNQSVPATHRADAACAWTAGPIASSLGGMPPLVMDDESRAPSLQWFARRQVAGGRSDGIHPVERLVEQASDLLECTGGSADRSVALALLTTAAVHLALVGRHHALFDAIGTLVDEARRTDNPTIRFRIARLACAGELARGDAKAACAQAECAYRAALEIGTPAARFESLILVVLMLEALGLSRDACGLALKLFHWRSDDPSPPLERLQRVNAVHGMRLCRRLDDLESAESFFGRLRDTVDVVALDDVMTTAAVAAAKAEHLAWVGKPRAAQRVVDDVLVQCHLPDSLRATALVRCVEARVRMASGDGEGMRSSADVLQALQARSSPSSSIHREIGRALVELDLGIGGAHVDSPHLEALRNEPAWPWFADIPLDFLWWTTSEVDVEPASAPCLHVDDEDRPFADAESGSVVAFDFDGFIAATPDVCAAENEASLRTPHYEIVESWTIAAEIAAGGNGRQCFKVGRVAAALGAALGFSDARCVMLDMACRLRDVGRAAVDCIDGDRGARVDAAWADSERAKAAERMLSFSTEPVLRLASRVARHRRLWWNGAGSAAVLWGEEIPIEARVCAVADALVEMVDPLEQRCRWSIERALQQIGCMGGVRFDPTLVGLLARVLHHESGSRAVETRQSRPVVAEDSLEKAKKHLFETLELVD